MSYAYVVPDNGGVLSIEENYVRWRCGDMSLLRARLKDSIEVAIATTAMHAEGNRYPVYTIIEFGKTAAGQWYPREQLPLLVCGGFLYDAVVKGSPDWNLIISMHDPVGNGAWPEETE